MAIVLFLLVFVITILVHELGHLFLAKLFKIKVEKFSIGFGRILWSRQIGETEYTVAPFLLGGYVKFAEEKEGSSLSPEDYKKLLDHKPVWQRFLVILAGPIFNFLLAIILIAGTYLIWGQPVFTSFIGKVSPSSPAEKAGLKKGDEITSINGHPTPTWIQMVEEVSKSSDGPLLKVGVERTNGQKETLTVAPEWIEDEDIFKEKVWRPVLGIMPAPPLMVKAPARSIYDSLKNVKEQIFLNGRALWAIGRGRIKPREALGGPLRIIEVGNTSITQGGWRGALLFMAAINVAVGFFNLLPIAPMDGGHFPFLFIEAVRGRPVSPQRQDLVFRVGLILLITLFIYVSFHDLLRLAAKK